MQITFIQPITSELCLHLHFSGTARELADFLIRDSHGEQIPNLIDGEILTWIRIADSVSIDPVAWLQL